MADLTANRQWSRSCELSIISSWREREEGERAVGEVKVQKGGKRRDGESQGGIERLERGREERCDTTGRI